MRRVLFLATALLTRTWKACFAAAIVFLAVPALRAESEYLRDFAFIQKTVAQRGAAIRSKKIDWPAACALWRPRFASCTNDTDHVKNVMGLLAVLRDSHTGVTRSAVDFKKLPSKWDGLYGGGLWFAWESGRLMLRGIMERHPLQGTLPLGSALIEIDGMPAWLAFEREKRRITQWAGSSSDHSLFSSMANRLLPFGDKQELPLKFLTPALKVKEVRVRRWGPGGKAFYPQTVEMPSNIGWSKGAVAGWLEVPWGEKVGYLRITGGMNEPTVTAFHKAFDSLQGMKSLVLDCRGMGGGGDYEAWEMAGRLFAKPVPNGRGRQLKPTGAWQFTGPVVMVQDELEVSSAETFTWAVTETERVLSVGRATGGWSIIPSGFKCPSGKVDFRLGVTDRPTPIRGVRTEGEGWPPHVLIPYGPVFCARPDPAREVGLQMLRLLDSGVPPVVVRKEFQQLFAGSYAAFAKRAKKFAKRVKGWKATALAALVRDDLKATLALELELLASAGVVLPNVLAAEARRKDLEVRARNAKLSKVAAKLKKLLSRAKAEKAAQQTFLKIVDPTLQAPPEDQKKFLKRYAKTRIGRWAKGFWK